LRIAASDLQPTVYRRAPARPVNWGTSPNRHDFGNNPSVAASGPRWVTMLLVTAEESRRLDALTIASGTPGGVLMDRAAAGAASVLLERFPHVRRRSVVVCAGKGNNGGDGFVMARLLRRKGVRAEVWLLGRSEEVRGDAARALASARRARVPITTVRTSGDLTRLQDRLSSSALVIDAIFGTGLNATVQGLHADVVHLLNSSGVPIFAVDMPSGLHADRGAPLGVAIQAEATATFGFAKIGQVIHPGVEHVGTLAVVDIGIADDAVAQVCPDTHLLEMADAGALVPARVAEAHKGTCGHVLVIAGSLGHTGAALLAAHAACRVGSGLTTLAGPASLNTIFASGVPEVMTAPLGDRDGFLEFRPAEMRRLLEGKSAVVVGPGLGTHEATEQLTRFLLTESGLPLVLDADALTCVARDVATLGVGSGRTILTPHPGEMARLLASTTATVQEDRVGVARSFAQQHGCVLVLKGARSVIASGEDSRVPVWINPTGNPGMASGGMGDALSGLLGGLLAQGLRPPDAACLGVYLHGAIADQLAGERGPIGILASDVIQMVPAGLARLRASTLAPAAGDAHRLPRRRG
jgi:hydroxyethylthiazole kinase-like uncharacterized protein yjeF